MRPFLRELEPCCAVCRVSLYEGASCSLLLKSRSRSRTEADVDVDVSDLNRD
jgi:hypothetical protein